ncbi:MAG: DEAD/DEAH box helicase [Planctomycetota bacterium]
MERALERFDPATRAWFEAAFERATDVQTRGWDAIGRGANVVLVAPTGSGKTLAAFLSEIDRIARLPSDAEPGVRCVYVSPLKALVADVERNLRAPLAGIRAAAARDGRELRPIRVDVRTGDTPQRERQRQSRDPGEILVTTPESLFLVLGSKQRETLRTVTTVIVDEIHALAPTKRGVHLALSLERLSELTERDPQRIGLSATVRPVERVAAFLAGDRPFDVVDASARPNVELVVRVPVDDMENAPTAPAEREPGGSVLGQVAKQRRAAALTRFGAPTQERGLWASIHAELLDAIRAHRSTIVFVNSRGLCERLTQRLNELAGEDLVLAHHGSVSHEKRAAIEDALKRGDVRAIVATSSLELGIDMGAVDQVLLVESPGSVARGLQRVGRAGHGVGETSRGAIFPKFRVDLLESAVVAKRMLAGEIEAVETPANCLDVLAQQFVAACCDAPRSPADLGRLARRSAPYRELPESSLVAVLEMLSGRYPSGELADLRPRLRWDRGADLLSARPGAAFAVRSNAGTIPDRGTFSVHVVGAGRDGSPGPRIGELDEEMVFETRDGDAILLGATTWRVESIDAQRVLVSPAPGEPGRLPFWKGDGPGRPIELGRAVGAFVREYGRGSRDEISARLLADLPLDARAAANLAALLHDQREHTGALPTDRAITVERFRDELGDWRVCILTPFGARVHAPWAMALERVLSERAGFEVSALACDDGIVLRLADADELPPSSAFFPDPEELDELLTDQLGSTSLFASLFRENAVRALLVTRDRPGRRSPLWLQRLRAKELLAVAKRFPSFPIVIETYRQALRDVFDLDGLRELLGGVRDRRVRVDDIETTRPSPFARQVVFAYVAEYLYDGDSPVAERKAQALTLDREMLRELLGEGELRELLDRDVLDEFEAELAGLADGRRARDRDEVHDLLRRVGDLTERELAVRVESPQMLSTWLRELVDERRAIRLRVADEERFVAAEDAGRFRDALGCAPPAGLPDDFLASERDPLGALVRRFARARGPFVAQHVAARYGLTVAQVEPTLRELEREGALVHGELRPGGASLEWCDAEVLRALKRRTIARLRREVAPVDGATFARFLASWQGVARGDDAARPRTSVGVRLEEVVAQLEGLPIGWEELATRVLPERVPGFRLDELDLLAAQGRAVWIGRGALGPHDGRIALFRRERVALAHEADGGEDEGSALERTPLHDAILAHLRARGASFVTEIERALFPSSTEARGDLGGAERRDLEPALWDLAWAGLLTNDTFQPLRSLARTRSSSRRAAASSALGGGRWSLVESLVGDAPSGTERAIARATALLERYGVVSREAANSDEVPGGWSPLYRVLRHMEESGRVRRGHFVEGLTGAQFASPGAADRLRAQRLEPDVSRAARITSIGACDPANPWGALLPWPEHRDGASPPRRVRGARVVLADGEPILFASPGGRRVSTVARGDAHDELFERAFAELGEKPRALGRKWLVVESIDGGSALASPFAPVLERVGFVREPKGYAADPAAARAALERRSGSDRARG